MKNIKKLLCDTTFGFDYAYVSILYKNPGKTKKLEQV